MHAVLVRVNIGAGHHDESVEWLTATLRPRVREVPGILAGYWLSSEEGDHGLALTVFEEAAGSAAAMAGEGPRPDYATFDSIDVWQVDASLLAAASIPCRDFTFNSRR